MSPATYLRHLARPRWAATLIASDIEEVRPMSDVLIRDVPDDVLAAVESHAADRGEGG